MGLNIVQKFLAKRRKHFNYLVNSNARLSPCCDFKYFIIKIPDSRALTLLARSLILALLIVLFPWLSSLQPGEIAILAKSADGFESDYSTVNQPELLPLLFHDLRNEGLFKLGDKALFMSSAGGDDDDEVVISSYSKIVTENEMLLVSVNDQERKSSIPNENFDFAFTDSFHVSSTDFIDRTLRIGGVLAIQLSHQNPVSSFKKPSNYEIVYLRRFKSMFLAMRKTGNSGQRRQQQLNAFANRKLLDFNQEEARKKALNKLEGVLLEPPRSSSRKSRTYQKRTRYLPDLMGDTLDLSSYPRRVFIDVGLPERQGGSGAEWFFKNYPTRNLEFEMYKIETVTEEEVVAEERGQQQKGMPEWLRENVKEEEYVVMKAEAEVVEEMVRGEAIRLVDELFLECKPKGLWVIGGRKSGRAYWECLALYGKLRDEGLAVHQWWG